MVHSTKRSAVDWGIPSLLAVVSVFLLWGWASVESPLSIQRRVADMDGTPTEVNTSLPTQRTVPVAGQPIIGNGHPSALAASWAGFRGPERNGISLDTTPLARTWPATGPRELWRIELCEGYASPAIADGRAYVLDYDEAAQADVIRCLSLDDGQELWRNGYGVAVTRNHGITRTVPAIVDDAVITLGPQCHVACWDRITGENRWLLDLVNQHAAVVPRWYAGQCPLVDQDRLILAVGGDSLLIAVDPQTGETIWASENPRQWEMTHVSIAVMTHAKRRVYVYCGSGGIAGIDATDGSILWDTTQWPVQFAHAPTPVPLPGGRFLVSSGYGSQVGAMIVQINAAGDGVEIERKLTPKEFNSEQQTPIVYQGHLFGVRKRGGGILVCMDLQGNEVWNSGRDRFGHGPYLLADGLLFVLSDQGTLSLVSANPERYERLASHQVFEDGHDAWGPMAIVGGRLFLRDMTRMACLDVSASNAPSDSPQKEQP